jgi:hypothetical protein
LVPPAVLVSRLVTEHKDHGPVKGAELDELYEQFVRFPIVGDVTPMDSEWILVGMGRLISHAISERSSLAPEEIASQYRQGVLMGRWRLEHVGYDEHAEIRENWLNVLGRLTAHSLHL